MNDERGTTGWTTQAFGLALSASAMLIVTAVSILLLDSTEVGMYAMTGVAVAGAFVVKRFEARWARAVGLLATIVLLSVFFVGFGLFQLFSPIDFIVGLLYVLGFFLGLVGGIRALARRKGAANATGGGRWQPALLSIIGVAAAISIVGFFLTKESVSEAEAAGATPLTMEFFVFNPLESSVPEGGSLLIHNADAFAHDFTLSELDIAVSIGPGSDALVDLTGLSAGTYEYVCSLHSDGVEGMLGTLVVGG